MIFGAKNREARMSPGAKGTVLACSLRIDGSRIVSSSIRGETLEIISRQSRVTGIDQDVVESRIQYRCTVAETKFWRELTIITNCILTRSLRNSPSLS
jgi:hypothetical protein